MHNTSWLRVETLKETLKLACHQKDFKFINFISFVDSVINNYYHDTDEIITVTSITIPNKNRTKLNCLFSVRAETSHILFTSRLRMETLNEPFQLRLKPFGGLGRGLWWLGEGVMVARGRGQGEGESLPLISSYKFFYHTLSVRPLFDGSVLFCAVFSLFIYPTAWILPASSQYIITFIGKLFVILKEKKIKISLIGVLYNAWCKFTVQHP